jgi:hypothetical protein
MSSLVCLDDELLELVDQIRRRLTLTRAEVMAIGLALLAARLRMPFTEVEGDR